MNNKLKKRLKALEIQLESLFAKYTGEKICKQTIPVHSISSELLDIAKIVTTPAIVYDTDIITHTVTQLKHDIKQIPNIDICFAVKANRCPAILQHMAKLGLGADIATTHELDIAICSGLFPIYATSPSFSVDDWIHLRKNGVIPDINSLSQLDLWSKHAYLGKEVGLRVRPPFLYSETYGILAGTHSRFGVDPTNIKLHKLIQKHNLKIIHLHFHVSEMNSVALVRILIDTAIACLDVFSYVKIINLGGGLMNIYNDSIEAQKAWNVLANSINVLNENYRDSIRFVLEPGNFLVNKSGYLISEVRAADEYQNYRLISLDISGLNILGWSSPQIVGQISSDRGEIVPHRFAGCSCYENDYLLYNQDVSLSKMKIGDRIIFNGVGAYASSMARSMHGLPTPSEWIIYNNKLERAIV